jgi:hypothetical protein
MANQNYSEFKVRSQNKNASGPGVRVKSGEYGDEHGSAHKDTPVSWPKAPGDRSPSLNAAGFPKVKAAVVADGVDL